MSIVAIRTPEFRNLENGREENTNKERDNYAADIEAVITSFNLSMLEASAGSWIGIVEKPLIQYRTAPASSNVRSMEKRLELMRLIIEKHSDSYHHHMADALLGIEPISDARLCQWENEVVHAVTNHQELSGSSKDFLQSPTYGDGGMAAAVRIASMDSQRL